MISPCSKQSLPFRMDLGMPWEHPVLDKGKRKASPQLAH